MRSLLLILLVIFSSLHVTGQITGTNLLPLPSSIQAKSGQLQIKGVFSIRLYGPDTNELLQKAVKRLGEKLYRKFNGKLPAEFLNNKTDKDSVTLLIYVEKDDTLRPGMDESYSLSVLENQVILKSLTDFGALRGLETLVQLIRENENTYFIPRVEIKDQPRFPWRGLMIDVARHFISMDVLKRIIEGMAEVKMNILHLHLTDNEGFRFESRKYPELQGKGSDGKYYTQSELKELVSFAADRGISIVPEFDMPGHSRSWFAGYPDLASSPGPFKPGPGYVADPANPVNPTNLLKYIKAYPTPAMNPANEATYAFLSTLLSEAFGVFPSAYFHMGVDENNGVAWRNNPAIVEFMTKKGMSSTDELQVYFAERINKILVSHSRTPIGWDEIFSPSISKNVIIQVWDTRAPKIKSIEILQHGNQEINSRGYYLDLFMPAYVHYLNDPLPYRCPDSLKNKVLGGEAAIWTELADDENIESRIWPRTAAIAERFWSHASVENVNDLYKRLIDINQSLATQGLQHILKYNSRIEKLAGNGDYEALKILFDLLSPVKGYKRVMAQFLAEPAGNGPSSLNNVADIANADPLVRRQFRMKVASYLDKPSVNKEKELRGILNSWSKNHEKIDSLLKANPKLKEILIHSKNLSELARIGIKALDYLRMNTRPPTNWSSDKLAVIRASSEASAEVELSIVPEIEALVRQKLTPEQKGYSGF